eukprot:gnl/MRDRNA2_/MRDRNA2_112461_c0_seq1.p1 gnl/MRDRNA2_/MRDRNA2_112461_c0~~gnl/MRDRNA2_/MRDRNA2_112461_c0_seq1.p1  ORF type:complete len:1487 (+),score=300.41 gnl/MRDRNA2_/MRDRNA2_112461_c0_seq1:131-4591(+)
MAPVDDNHWIATVAAQVVNTAPAITFAPPPRDHSKWAKQHQKNESNAGILLKRSSSVPSHQVAPKEQPKGKGKGKKGKAAKGLTVQDIQAWVDEGMSIEGPHHDKVIGNVGEPKKGRTLRKSVSQPTFSKSPDSSVALARAAPLPEQKQFSRSASMPLQVTSVDARTEAWVEQMTYKERQRELKLEQQRLDLIKHEADGCTYKPQLNDLGNARATYMDYLGKTKKQHRLSSDEEALLECTFRPKTTKVPQSFRTASDNRPTHERLYALSAVRAEKRRRKAAEEEQRVLSACKWHRGETSIDPRAKEMDAFQRSNLDHLGNIAERTDKILKARQQLLEGEQTEQEDDESSTAMQKPTQNRLSILRSTHTLTEEEEAGHDHSKVFRGWVLQDDDLHSHGVWEKASFWVPHEGGVHLEFESTGVSDSFLVGHKELEFEQMTNMKVTILEDDHMLHPCVTQVWDGNSTIPPKSFAFRTSKDQSDFQTVLTGGHPSDDNLTLRFADKLAQLFTVNADAQEEDPDGDVDIPVGAMSDPSPEMKLKFDKRKSVAASIQKIMPQNGPAKQEFVKKRTLSQTLRSIRPSRKSIAPPKRPECIWSTDVRYKNKFIDIFQVALGGEEIIELKPDKRESDVSRPTVGQQADESPLLTCATRGQLTMARQYQATSMNVNIQRSSDSMTALMICAERWDCHFIDWLLSRRAEVNLRDSKLKTSLHHAAMALHVNPEPNADPERGWSLPQKNITWIVKRLLSEKAQVDPRDEFGCTPLILAAANGVLEAVRSLVNSGAKINAVDSQLNSALHYAQQFRYGAVEDYLIEKGATIKYNKQSEEQEVANDFEVGTKSRPTNKDSLGHYQREARAEPGRILGHGRTIFVRGKKAAQRRKTAGNAGGDKSGGADSATNADGGEGEGGSESDDPLNDSPEAQKKRKDRALRKLREAQNCSNSAEIRAAIENAKDAGVTSSDPLLVEVEELLKLCESADQLAKMLEKATLTKDVLTLQKLIPRAKETGHCEASILANAEQCLKEELPRFKVREQLKKALGTENLEEMRAALTSAIQVQIPEKELKDIREMVEKIERRENARQEIMDLMAEAEGLDLENLDRMRDWRARMTGALRQGKQVGLDEEELKAADQKRRTIHNAIEDLKGSIRVFCRVRPMSKKELERGDKSCLKCTEVGVEIDHQHNARCGCPKGNAYTFDSVFSPGTQAQVFDDCVDLVQSVFDGFNITIFAYGQTGAGKTWTMNGNPKDEELWGVAPRTFKELFGQIEKKKDRSDFSVIFSMVELYRQDCIDLLRPKHIARVDAEPLGVRLDREGNVAIDGIIENTVSNTDELMTSYDYGMNMRSVAATAMNSESSRSHLILIIRMTSKNKTTGEVLRGKILICDLAGSERLKKSEVTGDGQKEAIEINKSLTALGDVMLALTDKNKKGGIPYRNHKLTQVMQDSLGGSAKTLMFMNCSPSANNLDETTMSLKWAMRAKKVTNIVSKNRG